MKTNTNITITTSEEAKVFLSELYTNDEDYHPEDGAETIINFKTGENVFSEEEAEKLNKLMNSVYEVADFDPCEFLLDLQNNG